ncbi:MAG: SBBP repeat-containing protein [Candidatus Aminicenantes bacterium]|nr:SBBP repeat-containing protein [Candidatus Aminicenantes bacterium]
MERRILAGAVLMGCLLFSFPGTTMPVATAGATSARLASLAGRIDSWPDAPWKDGRDGGIFPPDRWKETPAKGFLPRVTGGIQTRPDFGKMPVTLIPNRGQLAEQIDFYIQGKDKTIYFGSEGLTFILTKAAGKKTSDLMTNPGRGGSLPPDPASSLEAGTGARPEREPRWVVKLDFVGADPGVKPVGTDRTGTVISYFQGTPGDWKSGLPSYSRIVYANLWPGIDLAYSGTMDELKYEFVVHPGADPSRIRLAYRGASSVQVNAEGRLTVTTPSGGFEDGAPVAYQEDSRTRVNVPMEYRIADPSPGKTTSGGARENEGDAVTYGFSLGEYDPTRSLVLDPMILVYCGYVGGPNFDYGYGIAADKKGNAYITGYTSSMDPVFPVTVGPDLSFNGGSMDAFVAKVNAAGTALDYCGFIGGSGDDYAYAVAVDPSGNATVTGYTSSTESTFPVKVGPDLTQNGLVDAFVAKINAGGTALAYCGYIGGSSHDYGRGIAVDASGNAYVTGYTSSTESTFPVAVGPSLVQSGNNDAFVAKVQADGKALAYCGYIGGSGQDYGRGIAVDASGSAYVTGSTNSTETTFPIVVGPYSTANGDFDAFVAKVSAEGTELLYCGYIGGSSEDVGTGIAVDGDGSAYIAGYTASSDTSFPVNGGPNLTHNGGVYDAFVAKVYFNGLALDYCGYIGGSAYDVGTGIAVDRWGYAYVAGYTSSKEDTFPVNVGPGLTLSGSFDAFVAKVDTNGAKLLYCGYIGGLDADLGQGLALDADGSGNVYLTGNTYSTESSFPVLVGPDLSQNGSRDGFVTKINEMSIVVTSPNGGETLHTGLTHDITWLSFGQVGNVRIEYSTDSGTTWTDITGSTENDGSYNWLVPDAASTSCGVRISEAEDGDPSDINDVVFEISNNPIIIVTSPNGGESWAVGSTKDITWLSAGVAGNVKIEYSTDNNATWTEITGSTENDGIYAWLIPDAASDTCLVRISRADEGTPVDLSDAVFSIKAASILITDPRNSGRGRSAGLPKIKK